mgnify:CR=1 FL=1
MACLEHWASTDRRRSKVMTSLDNFFAVFTRSNQADPTGAQTKKCMLFVVKPEATFPPRRGVDVDDASDARGSHGPAAAQNSAHYPLAPLGQCIAIARDAAFGFSYPLTIDGWR